MKKYLLFLAFFLCTLNLYSQVKFEIAELNVSNIKPNLSDKIYDEGETDGPYIYMNCVYSNESNTSILLFPSKSDIEILFNYRGIEYKMNAIAMPFTDNDSLIIKSHEKIEFNLGTHIFLGTPLWEGKRSDYTMILLETLPTIRVRYKDLRSNLFSTMIEKVTIL
jgi:hypothetical protein